MDPIANLLTSIRNGYLSRKDEIVVPFSKIKESIVSILAKHGYLKAYQVEKAEIGQQIKITLHYLANGKPVLTNIKRVSTPSVRRYSSLGNVPQALSGAGITILTTPKGVMTDAEAKTNKVGGEVICLVW